MRGYVGNTDFDWYSFLVARPELQEVNFWQPSGGRKFAAVAPGDPFFFKLKKPHCWRSLQTAEFRTARALGESFITPQGHRDRFGRGGGDELIG